MSTPITPQLVKQLRDRTDQPMGLCKQALEQSGGDIDKAIEWLRAQNAKMGVKREGSETAEGRIGLFYDNTQRIAAIVEVRCETAPSAKSDPFIALVNDLARHIASSQAADVPTLLAERYDARGTVQDRLNDAMGVIREKMVIHRFARLQGGIYGGYVHFDGTVGTLVECQGSGPNDELLRDVAAHITAMNPPYRTPSDVPAEVIEKEKALIRAEIEADPKNAGKPANILDKIAEGKLKTRLAELVLSEQTMANAQKYPNLTVSAALKKAGLELTRFVRYKVGAISLV
ncbi:translation elongation factor Ts [Thermogemmata fonticola]|uniref:Elongation factor Ts n=1 Tax=Thermogemmata fonticola TaxID=2755323 RepID=A0A7V8VCB4_9BACT|nr:translation elongation factor Ts [Thermogemmata fonticola]MBA2225235.1 translation elongation factor Ts [Thermogemmata fonticola]